MKSVSGKLCLCVLKTDLSKSELKIVLKPAFSNPRLIPPTPENKSMHVKFSVFLILFLFSKVIYLPIF